MQKQRRNNQMVVQPWGRSWFLLKEICVTMCLSSSTELEPPPKRRMVTLDWTQDSWSTALLPHHQPIKQTKKSHKPCSPHPKCCLLFLGTSDDHPVRSPVWPLSISSLRRANNFKLNCCYYKGKCWFQTKKYFDLDQVERDFCSARQIYPHAQQEEATEERDLRPNSQEISWVWSLSGGSC